MSDSRDHVDDENTQSPDDQGYSQLPMSTDDDDTWDALEPETESSDSDERISCSISSQPIGDDNESEADGISEVELNLAALAVQTLDAEYQRICAEPDLNAIVRERVDSAGESDKVNSNLKLANSDETEDDSGTAEKDSNQQEQLDESSNAGPVAVSALSKDTVDEVRAIMSLMKMPPPPARFAECGEEDWDKIISGLQRK